ncbi:nitrilase-related carbon-nitrogen hydrolase [Sneathiella glossodoripedis]|uniref:nitrilase-related carbon-nitrogen hydrolase n=1 Tax=Sneathiella glossodoripedis TaxID=418853 RepID=UPI000472CA29|nr:nitrilase-related carbon-nitrogen hydrolase [Sneathiella glossodoripedis]
MKIFLSFLAIIFLSTGTLHSKTLPISVKVAAIQLQSADAGNFQKMKMLAMKAKEEGAQLVVFPESSVFGWLNPEIFTKAEPIPGGHSDQFVDIAKTIGIWVAAGLAEKGPKAGEGSLPDAYYAYDSGILVSPQGEIVIHHRKFNVLKNAFNPEDCRKILNEDQCSYMPGPISDVKTVQTPFGKTSLMVCADAYVPSEYNPGTAIKALKKLEPEFVIVPWGVTAGTMEECGKNGFNATGFAEQAASFLSTAFVIGSNAVGTREYGKYLPSYYCGTSGYSDPTGKGVEASEPTAEIAVFDIQNRFVAKAGPIWNNAVDAPKKCPPTCKKYNASWNGEWWTTVWGKMSVCECTPGPY